MPTQSAEQHREFVRKQLQAGRPPHAIVSMLKVRGLDATGASQLIAAAQASGEAVRPAPTIRPTGEMPSFLSAGDEMPPHVLPRAAAAGALSAAICGIVWGIVTYATSTEFAYLALGVGALCGIAVRAVSEGYTGMVVRLLAGGFSVAGIGLGKYLSVYFFVTRNAALLAQYPEVARLKLFGLEYALVFLRLLPKVLGAGDILFVFLAIYMAFKVAGNEQVS